MSATAIIVSVLAAIPFVTSLIIHLEREPYRVKSKSTNKDYSSYEEQQAYLEKLEAELEEEDFKIEPAKPTNTTTSSTNGNITVNGGTNITINGGTNTIIINDIIKEESK